jgi:hypothetical protein
MLETWTRELFEQALNSRFEMGIPGIGRQSLELIAVSRYPSSPAVVAFSVLFRGPLEQPFSQGTYSICHDRMGQADLFLVPVGREADGMHYEAVFNRLVKPLERN